jgi:hypothetical protein
MNKKGFRLRVASPRIAPLHRAPRRHAPATQRIAAEKGMGLNG